MKKECLIIVGFFLFIPAFAQENSIDDQTAKELLELNNNIGGIQVQLQKLSQQTEWQTFVTIILGVLAVWIAITIYRIQHEQSSKQKVEIQNYVDMAANQIVQKVVDIANAQLRVKEGGTIALRKDGNVNANLVRNVTETVSIGSNVSTEVTRAKDVKPIAQNIVQHSTDSLVVARNVKTFTVDAVLITQEQQLKNLKKELINLKRKHSRLYSKKSSKKKNKKPKSRKR